MRKHFIPFLFASALSLSANPSKADPLSCADTTKIFNTITTRHHALSLVKTREQIRQSLASPHFAQLFVDNVLFAFDPEHQVLLQSEIHALATAAAQQIPTLLETGSGCSIIQDIHRAYTTALQSRRAHYPTLENFDLSEIADRAAALDPTDEANPELVANRASWATTPDQLSDRFKLAIAYRYRLLSDQFSDTLSPADTLRAAYMHTMRTREQGSIAPPAPHSNAALVLKHLLHSLDPYSDYDPSITAENPISGPTQAGYIGLGFTGRWTTYEGILLKTIAPDGPLALSGTTPGDTITAVNGKKLSALSDPEIKAILACPADHSPVSLTIRRAGTISERHTECGYVRHQSLQPEPEFSITPQRSPLGKLIFNIKIDQFTDGLFEQITAEIVRLSQAYPPDGFILDLRGNPGGFNIPSHKLASIFLGGGLKMQQREADGTPQGQFLTEKDLYRDLAFDQPLVILTDNGTASAAEHTAGSLQDYNRAIIVSEKAQTYGKGTAFKFYFESDLGLQRDDLGTFTISDAYYFLPSGRSPQLDGIPTDIIVGNDPAPSIPLMKDLPNALPHIESIPPDISAKWISDSCKADFIASLDPDELAHAPEQSDHALIAGLRVLDKWITSPNRCLFENKRATERPWSPLQDPSHV